MSVYCKVVCHTCQKQVDLAGYTDEFVVKFAGEWARYRHMSHHIAILIDACLGFDDDYDKLYDEVQEYEKIEIE